MSQEQRKAMIDELTANAPPAFTEEGFLRN